MHTTDPAARAEFVTGLRTLADFITAHPHLPVPVYGCDVIVNAHGTDEERRAEVNKIAVLLGVTAEDLTHLRASRTFGPIEYRAVAIPTAEMAAHRALMTYADNVAPDDPATDRKEARTCL